MPQRTEAERLVVQRIGQDIFRERLLDYWRGACAVTGIDQPELLRASHIKPWSACEDSPAERLDIANGLILSADYDAAFDAGLISFDQFGAVVLSPRLSSLVHTRLRGGGVLNRNLLTARHEGYLDWHRRNVFR